MDNPPEHHDAVELLEEPHFPAELPASIVFVIVSALLLSQIDEQTKVLNNAALFSQPGFWSGVGLGGMTLFGLMNVFFAWRRCRRLGKKGAFADLLDMARAVEFCGWFMAYVWITPWLGYLPTTLLFCVGLCLRLGYRRRRYLIAAMMTGTATVVLFKSLLQVKIPGAALYELLPMGLRNFMTLYL